MIKASALKPIGCERPVLTTDSQNFNKQNMIIESISGDQELIPQAVENLAYRMMCMDSVTRDIISELRALYVQKKESFHICLDYISGDSKKEVIELLRSMYGIIYGVSYCTDCDILSGKIVLSNKAQRFITGQYMEIATKKVVKDVLNEMETLHGIHYELYNNVKVNTLDGMIKNEFDLVIKDVSDSIVYVIECKSGKNFDDFDKLSRIGKEYGIVPNRLLLIDNYLSEDQMEIVEYFCDYYVTNLEHDNIKNKLTKMLENDLKED
jgi:hypothetical protein